MPLYAVKFVGKPPVDRWLAWYTETASGDFAYTIVLSLSSEEEAAALDRHKRVYSVEPFEEGDLIYDDDLGWVEVHEDGTVTPTRLR